MEVGVGESVVHRMNPDPMNKMKNAEYERSEERKSSGDGKCGDAFFGGGGKVGR